jgi:nitrogen fixation protein FixH
MNPEMTADAQKPVLTGRKMFAIFACFFGTIATADAFLITSAVRTWSGTEANSAYKAGQLYNSEFARAQAQEARGWRLDPVAIREADGTVHASLERPTDKRGDRALDLTEAEPGTYAAVAHNLAPGQWDLVVDVVQDGERAYRRKTRVVLK